jgi:hypothetical protein
MGGPVRLLLALAGLASLAGCGVLGPQPVDVAPGQRIVLGRDDLSGLDVSEGIVDVVRQDGGFSRELRIGQGAAEFAVGLPAGRYRIVSFRGAKDGRTLSDQFIRYLNVAFDVGDAPAVYVGTLRVASSFGPALRVTVVDEMEDTLRVLRRRYSDLPPTATRALMTPG